MRWTPGVARENIAKRLLPLLRLIPLPHPFDGVREKLSLSVANTVAGSAAEEVLIFVPLLLEDLGHPVVGFNPVVHAVAHHVGVEQILIADRDENADRLLRLFGNQRFVE